MVVGGTFADDDDPASFTWLRGFADHGARVRAVTAFYGGPVWAQHGDAANATMLDSDDVLVLRPTRPAHWPAPAVVRGGPGDRPRLERVLVGTYGLTAAGADAVEEWFATQECPAFEEVLGVWVTTWRTDPTPNAFPRLPVRGERALAWLAVFPDADARDAAAARLAVAGAGDLDRRARWRRTFRLTPTARSAHPAAEPPRTQAAARDSAGPAAG